MNLSLPLQHAAVLCGHAALNTDRFCTVCSHYSECNTGLNKKATGTVVTNKAEVEQPRSLKSGTQCRGFESRWLHFLLPDSDPTLKTLNSSHPVMAGMLQPALQRIRIHITALF